MRRTFALALLTLLLGACTSDRPAGDEPRPRPDSVQEELPAPAPIAATPDVPPAGTLPDAAVAPAEPAPMVEPVKEPEADSADAISALEALGATLRRDGDGGVIEVSFRGTSAGDEAMKHLAGLPKLRAVLLNDTAISDAGLAAIGAVATLENLDLRGCAVSNAGLEHLKGLGRLRA